MLAQPGRRRRSASCAASAYGPGVQLPSYDLFQQTVGGPDNRSDSAAYWLGGRITNTTLSWTT